MNHTGFFQGENVLYLVLLALAGLGLFVFLYFRSPKCPACNKRIHRASRVCPVCGRAQPLRPDEKR